MSPWLRVLEAYAVAALLRTPAFHRLAERAARQVHRLRHGSFPSDPVEGHKIDSPERPSGFLGHFSDEIKAQLGAEKQKEGSAGVNMDSRAMGHAGEKSRVEKVEEKVDEWDAERSWRETEKNVGKAPKQGFLGEYMGALREQVKGGGKGG